MEIVPVKAIMNILYIFFFYINKVKMVHIVVAFRFTAGVKMLTLRYVFLYSIVTSGEMPTEERMKFGCHRPCLGQISSTFVVKCLFFFLNHSVQDCKVHEQICQNLQFRQTSMNTSNKLRSSAQTAATIL